MEYDIISCLTVKPCHILAEPSSVMIVNYMHDLIARFAQKFRSYGARWATHLRGFPLWNPKLVSTMKPTRNTRNTTRKAKSCTLWTLLMPGLRRAPPASLSGTVDAAWGYIGEEYGASTLGASVRDSSWPPSTILLSSQPPAAAPISFPLQPHAHNLQQLAQIATTLKQPLH